MAESFKPSSQADAETDLEVTRIAIPAIIGVAYGIYAFTKYGFDLNEWLRTYLPVAGGITAAAGTMAAFGLGRFRGLYALCGFAPWTFAIYMLGFLGMYGAYLAIADHVNWLSIAGSVVWMLLGWHMLTKVTAAVDRRSQHN